MRSSSLMNAGRYAGVYRATVKGLMRLMREERGSGEPLPEERLATIVKEWSEALLSVVGVELEVRGAPISEEPVLLVGNHVSYLDIPVLMSQRPVSFVAKKELRSWPIFGYAAARAGTVFVERESPRSRAQVAQAVARRLGDRSVAIFPSGTTTLDESRPWRRGAFRIAKEVDVPIQPFRIRYDPLRASAYIDDDFFPTHLWRLLRKRPIRVTLELHEPVRVDDPDADVERWRRWAAEK